MKYQQVHTDTGYLISMPHDENGYYCTNCAFLLGWHPPYDLSGHPSCNICPRCKVEFGCDDGRPDSLRDTMSEGEYQNQLRKKLLDKMSWEESLLNEMSSILKIDMVAFKAKYFQNDE